MRLPHVCSCGAPGIEALTHIGNALICLPSLSQYPAPPESAHHRPERKPLLGRKGHSGFCPLESSVILSAELMKPGTKVEGKRQTMGMRQVLRQAECLLALP